MTSACLRSVCRMGLRSQPPRTPARTGHTLLRDARLEHCPNILLGLIREGDGVAAQVLVKLGADLNRVRQQVIQLLHDYQAKT